MKLKLIDYKQKSTEVRTGTCELCFGTMACNKSTFVFQKENGDIVEVKGYYQDWGDYYSVETVVNVIDFAEYVGKIDFQECENTFSFNWLDKLVCEYNSAKEQAE